MYKLHGILPVRIAALPLSNLHNTVVLLGGTNHNITFFDTVSQRLLAVNIFSSLTGSYHLQTMPVVRSSHNYHVNVFIVDKAAPVFVQIFYSFPCNLFCFGCSFIQNRLVDVGKSHTLDLRVTQKCFQIFESHAITANKSYTYFVTGRNTATRFN